VNSVPDSLLLRKSGSTRNQTRTSGSVARNSDHETREAVLCTDMRCIDTLTPCINHHNNFAELCCNAFQTQPSVFTLMVLLLPPLCIRLPASFKCLYQHRIPCNAGTSCTPQPFELTLTWIGMSHQVYWFMHFLVLPNHQCCVYLSTTANFTHDIPCFAFSSILSSGSLPATNSPVWVNNWYHVNYTGAVHNCTSCVYSKLQKICPSTSAQEACTYHEECSG
jgi:hypothetical protein